MPEAALEAFRLITKFGDEAFFLLALPVIYLSIDKRFGIGLALLLLFSFWFNMLSKDLLQLPRPPSSQWLIDAQGYSFPSGHAQSATLFWGMVAARARKNSVYILSGMLIIMVSYSRVYLGVHYPQDVAGGVLVGLLFLAGYLSLASLAREFIASLPLKAKISLSFIIPMAMMLVAFFLSRLVPPFLLLAQDAKVCGALAGLCAGVAVENEKIGIKTSTSLKKRLLRGAVGILLLASMYGFLKLLLPPGLLFTLTGYILLGVTISLLSPYAISRIER